MATSKIPFATKIPLTPLNGEQFFAIVIEGHRAKRTTNELWLFREGCGVALFHSASYSGKDDPTMTYDGIRTLDAVGEFDENKEELCTLR